MICQFGNFAHGPDENSGLFVLFVGLFVNISVSQTSVFTVQYFDFKAGTQSDVAALYDSFFEGVEFKSGGLFLERMDRGDVLGTHRIVYFGELGMLFTL